MQDITKDILWMVVAIACVIALVTVSIVTDTPLFTECNVNTQC